MYYLTVALSRKTSRIGRLATAWEVEGKRIKTKTKQQNIKNVTHRF